MPKDLTENDETTSGLHTAIDRVFDIQLMNNELTNLEQSGDIFQYSGMGWEYGNLKIFAKIKNINACNDWWHTHQECNGDYGLISAGFLSTVSFDDDNDCWFPHTILKHTIYFHCGPDSTDPIIDSIYWVYDNTRGKMNSYPFSTVNGVSEGTLDNSQIDVVFRPSFMQTPENTYILYNTASNTSNKDYYNSGFLPNSGSVNYFPPQEIQNDHDCCQNQFYTLYYDPGTLPPYGSYSYDGSVYGVSFVHPPSYVLLDAPLLNTTGNTWAGYDYNGEEQNGIPHKYEINHSVDLRYINPVEKIIYNPSYVHVYVDLTFPCDYKFITIHGKYPDKENEVLAFFDEYWFDKGVYFRYERDYLTPVNRPTNFEPLSYYKVYPGVTITIEPNVIIMNARFIGSSSSTPGYIAYDPEHKLGNWDYDDETIDTIELNYDEMDCDYFYPPHHGSDSL
ncbi:MAG: hypothetical protein U9R60_16205 [Bacteroidota bacterium]|nr:hypothetical protein [Bacteroidota bacterium]